VEYFLVPQAFALILGAGILFGARARPAPRRKVRSLTVVIAVAGMLGSALALAVVERRLWRQAGDVRELSAFDRATLGGQLIGVRVRFVEWSRRLIPPDDSYALEVGRNRRWSDGYRSAVREWSTYRLLPRPAAARRKAEWLIFYGIQPEEAGYPRRSLARLEVFDDGYAVARRSG